MNGRAIIQNEKRDASVNTIDACKQKNRTGPRPAGGLLCRALCRGCVLNNMFMLKQARVKNVPLPWKWTQFQVLCVSINVLML